MSKPLRDMSLLAIWALGILFLLAVSKLNRIKLFDPNGTLVEQAANFEFDNDLIEVLLKRGIEGANLIHFTVESPCYCNTLSQRFSNTLVQSLGSEFSFHTIIVDAELSQLIPSYPAIAVIDDENHLRYFGPYASGLGCWVGKGNVAKIVDIAQSKNYFGAIINSQVSGCYCST